MDLTVGVLVTRRCQSSCKHCFVGKRNVELSSTDFSLILNFCKEIGAHKVKILGGEPLIFSELQTLIDILADLQISITTNGIFLPSWLLNEEPLLPIEQVNVSLHYFEPKRYSSFTSMPDKALDTVKKNIIFLAKKYNVWVNTCIMPDNQSDIDSIIEFSKESGVQGVKISHLVLENSAKNNFEMKINEFHNNAYFESIHEHKCLVGQRYVIDSNLDVFGCIAHVNNKSFRLGKLGVDSSLSIVKKVSSIKKQYHDKCILGEYRL